MAKTKTSEDNNTKASFKETLSTVIWALAIAFIMRTFLFQPFHIPSGSMLPGLMKGDYIITSKYSVGYGRYAASPLPFPVKKGRLFERGPDRGDVVVFRPDGSKNNYIKRLIGLPGDQIQMQGGVLFINGKAAKQDLIGTSSFKIRGADITGQNIRETLSGGEVQEIYNSQMNNDLDNTGVYTVPAGHYFVMGDNRDHSLDSRVAVRNGGAGNVPKENIIGRAEIVLLSVTEDFSLIKPWTWGHMRGDRFFKGIE